MSIPIDTAEKPPFLAFTPEDLEKANRDWGCSCGPAALAAMFSMPLEAVRPHLGYFQVKRHMNPGDMASAFLRLSGNPPRNLDQPRTRIDGIARVQWGGPWMLARDNPKWAMKHTHWTAMRRVGRTLWVYDINGGWVPSSRWREDVAVRIMESVDRCDGTFTFTHYLTVTR